MSTLGALLGIHVQTPLHAGAGTALGTVDLPIQRERHTHWPNIAGSALKGILRDACRERLKSGYKDDSESHEDRRQSQREKANAHDDLTAAFGPPNTDADKHAGAISITDARLLAFPVRSLKGVFAWVTCRQALDRLLRDAALAGFAEKPFELPTVPGSGKLLTSLDSPCVFDDQGTKRIILEEYDFVQNGSVSAKLTDWIVANLLSEEVHFESTRESFKKRLLVLHDDDFTHFARHATEVSARIALDYDTKTVKSGALFYQEFLPAESLLYAVVLAHPARGGAAKSSARDVLKTVTEGLPPVLQIGGDETTGKGLCAIRVKSNGGGK